LVERRDREQVRELVVVLLVCPDLRFCALLASTDNVVGDLEGLQLDSLDLGRVERVRLTQLEHRLERRLGVDLGVVALQEGPSDTLEILALPVNLEPSRDRVHESFVPLEYLGRAGDAPA